jgi:hypothetical protein
MTNDAQKLSNSFSTGGGGVNFEIQVQASFVTLMLANGFSPCLPCRPIQKIKLQGLNAGYKTDDLIVFTGTGPEEGKLLGQIKHKISITRGNAEFGKVIASAWADFISPEVFNRNKDVIALITGPLSATDTEDVRRLLEWARSVESYKEFFQNVAMARFSSDGKRAKLAAFRKHIDTANGAPISDRDFFRFLRHFHLLGYDLDIRSGVMHTILHSVIGRQSVENPDAIFAQIVQEVMSINQNAGTITRETLSEECKRPVKAVLRQRLFSGQMVGGLPVSPVRACAQAQPLTSAACSVRRFQWSGKSSWMRRLGCVGMRVSRSRR